MNLFGIQGISQISQSNTDAMRNAFLLGLQRQEAERARVEELNRIKESQDRANSQGMADNIFGAIGGGIGSMIGGQFGGSDSSRILGATIGQTLFSGGAISPNLKNYTDVLQNEISSETAMRGQDLTMTTALEKARMDEASKIKTATQKEINDAQKEGYYLGSSPEDALNLVNQLAPGSQIAEQPRPINLSDGSVVFAVKPIATADTIKIQQETANDINKLRTDGWIFSDSMESSLKQSKKDKTKVPVQTFNFPGIGTRYGYQRFNERELQDMAIDSANLDMRRKESSIAANNLLARHEEAMIARERLGFEKVSKALKDSTDFVDDKLITTSSDYLTKIDTLKASIGVYKGAKDKKAKEGALSGIVNSGVARTLAGEVGVMTDKDITRNGGSRDLKSNIQRAVSALTTGKTLTEGDIAAFEEVMQVLERNTKTKVNDYIDRKTATNKSIYGQELKAKGIDPAKLDELVAPYKYELSGRLSKIQQARQQKKKLPIKKAVNNG